MGSCSLIALMLLDCPYAAFVLRNCTYSPPACVVECYILFCFLLTLQSRIISEFINLISSESNEVCNREEKRTIAPEHVIKALEVFVLSLVLFHINVSGLNPVIVWK